MLAIRGKALLTGRENAPPHCIRSVSTCLEGLYASKLSAELSDMTISKRFAFYRMADRPARTQAIAAKAEQLQGIRLPLLVWTRFVGGTPRER